MPYPHTPTHTSRLILDYFARFPTHTTESWIIICEWQRAKIELKQKLQIKRVNTMAAWFFLFISVSSSPTLCLPFGFVRSRFPLRLLAPNAHLWWWDTCAVEPAASAMHVEWLAEIAFNWHIYLLKIFRSAFVLSLSHNGRTKMKWTKFRSNLFFNFACHSHEPWNDWILLHFYFFGFVARCGMEDRGRARG